MQSGTTKWRLTSSYTTAVNLVSAYVNQRHCPSKRAGSEQEPTVPYLFNRR